MKVIILYIHNISLSHFIMCFKICLFMRGLKHGVVFTPSALSYLKNGFRYETTLRSNPYALFFSTTH